MPAGRPRQFDRDDALSKAMQLFWRQGYEHTGLTQLLEETGLARQSLYNAFGDKHKLYVEALGQYSSGWLGLVKETLEAAPTVTDGIREVLMAYVNTPDEIAGFGCMVVNAGSEFATGDEKVHGMVEQHMRSLSNLLETAIEQGQAKGEISLQREADVAALTLVNSLHGLALMARAGFSRQESVKVVEENLRILSD